MNTSSITIIIIVILISLLGLVYKDLEGTEEKLMQVEKVLSESKQKEKSLNSDIKTARENEERANKTINNLRKKVKEDENNNCYNKPLPSYVTYELQRN